jgi:hypothetical protein
MCDIDMLFSAYVGGCWHDGWTVPAAREWNKRHPDQVIFQLVRPGYLWAYAWNQTTQEFDPYPAYPGKPELYPDGF